MILQPCNTVELTKVYYYDKSKRDQNVSVSTITREMYQNSFNKNVVIKKNIFGQKWVLQINHAAKSPKKSQTKPKKCLKCMLYFIMILFLAALLAFGIFFTLDTYFWQNSTALQDLNITIEAVYPNNSYNHNAEDNHIISTLLRRKYRTHEKQLGNFLQENTTLNGTQDNSTISESVRQNREFCSNCTSSHVCLKLSDTQKPKCVEILDPKDPTGCGGLCKINTEYCKMLDKESEVFQCVQMKNNSLRCEEGEFNCGNRCIPLRKRCDGWIDCTDKTDEIECECMLDTHFQCGNLTSCLENSKKCDGVIQCWDHSDEMNCQKVSKCPKDHVQCLNGQCIPKEKFCDRKTDCKDRSDEPKWCQ